MVSSFGSLTPLNIIVPSGYGYVGLAATSALWLSMFQGYYQVGAARRAAKVPYPQAYAEKAEAEANKEAFKFNCVQRAHAVSRHCLADCEEQCFDAAILSASHFV